MTTVSGPDHYFTDDPRSARTPQQVRLRIDGESVELTTSTGTFSPRRIDPGTALLLESLPPPSTWPEGPVLDLGCGYGPLAVAVAHRSSGTGREVWAVDVNARARDDCRANVARLGLEVRVAAPDEVPEGHRFAVIVSNPPVRIGKDALHSLLEHWLDRLRPDGVAWLVVSRHLGADSLAAWLTERGRSVERVRSRRGYRVLQVR